MTESHLLFINIYLRCTVSHKNYICQEWAQGLAARSLRNLASLVNKLFLFWAFSEALFSLHSLNSFLSTSVSIPACLCWNDQYLVSGYFFILIHLWSAWWVWGRVWGLMWQMKHSRHLPGAPVGGSRSPGILTAMVYRHNRAACGDTKQGWLRQLGHWTLLQQMSNLPAKGRV